MCALLHVVLTPRWLLFATPCANWYRAGPGAPPPPRLDQTHAGALNILKIWEAWVSGELRPAYLCRPGDDGTGNY